MSLKELLDEAARRQLYVAADGELTEEVLKDAIKTADEIDAFCEANPEFAATGESWK